MHRFWATPGAIATLIASAAVLGLAAPPAQAQPECGYDVQIIEGHYCDVFEDWDLPSPQGLTSTGVVVGLYNNCIFTEDAFIWTLRGGFVTLERLEGFSDVRAYDANASGWIVGAMRNDVPNHGVVWIDGVPIEIGIPDGGTWSEALAINDSGIIAGYWGNHILGGWSAFVWDGEMIDLSADFATEDSRAFGINEAGKITGWMGESNTTDSHAFIWDDGVVADLGVIPGGFTAEGAAINDADQVVGVGFIPSEDDPGWVRHAYYWDGEQGHDLGVLPGCLESWARGINSAGQIIGDCEDPLGKAFIWEDGVMTALDDLVPPELELNIQNGRAINDAGQLTGNGWMGNETYAFLLTPIPGPVGDIDADCDVDGLDLIMLLGSWGACDKCPADLDHDGVVGTADLIVLLGNWG